MPGPGGQGTGAAAYPVPDEPSPARHKEGLRTETTEAEACAFRGTVEPVLFDQRCNDELVKKATKQPIHRVIEIKKELSAGAPFPPVSGEASIAIDWAGRNGWEEK